MKNTFLMILLAILISAIFFVPKFNFAIKTNETIKVPEQYTSEEYVDVEMPVNETVSYGIKECKERPYNYSARFEYSYPIINNTIKLLCSLNITNLESKEGNFSFYITFYKQNNITVDYLDQTKEIKPNETANFAWYDNITSLDNLPTCEYKIKEIPKLEKCPYVPAGFYTTKEVAKTTKVLRNITKYREVELPKYETRRMSLAGYLLLIIRQPFS